MPYQWISHKSHIVETAQSTPRVDQRQENQEKRIDKGVASGKITQKEAARLEKGQERVQKTEDRAMKDGKLTKQEKAPDRAYSRCSEQTYRARDA